MDPNETLRRLRKLANRIFSDMSAPTEDDAVEMAELFRALDGWIVNGGFLPERWSQGVRKLPGE